MNRGERWSDAELQRVDVLAHRALCGAEGYDRLVQSLNPLFDRYGAFDSTRLTPQMSFADVDETLRRSLRAWDTQRPFLPLFLAALQREKFRVRAGASHERTALRQSIGQEAGAYGYAVTGLDGVTAADPTDALRDTEFRVGFRQVLRRARLPRGAQLVLEGYLAGLSWAEACQRAGRHRKWATTHLVPLLQRNNDLVAFAKSLAER